MLIYVDGDSFTAGVGLFDRFFVDDYDVLLSKGVVSREKYAEYNDYRQECCFKKEIKNVEVEEKRRTFAYKLSVLLNSEVINSAQGGSSLQGICTRTMLKLVQLQNEGKKIDFCIIGLTAIERLAIYDHIRANLPSEPITNWEKDYKWIVSLLPSHHVNLSGASPYHKYLKEYINLVSYESFALMYLDYLAKIKCIVRSFTHRDPIFIPLYSGELEKFQEFTNPDILDLIDFTGIMNVPKELHLSYWGTNSRLYCGHYDEYAHDNISRAIVKYLKEQKYVE